MKNISIFIFLLTILCVKTFSQTWTLQTSGAPSGAHFRTVFVESAGYVVAGGNDGVNRLFKKTVDGGVNWYHSAGMTLNYPIYDLYVQDDFDHFAITPPFIVKTNNPDGSWAGIYGGVTFNKFYFRNNDTIMSVGSASGFPRVDVSRNGGFTWDWWGSGTYGTNTEWLNIFNQDNYTWIIGANGKINRNNDALASTTWEDISPAVTDQLNGIFFLNSTTGFVVGNNGLILKTTNSGTTWTSSYPTIFNLQAVTFVSATEGWVVGGNGIILHTTNAGTSWTSFTSPTTQTLYDVDFLNPLVGYAVGANGTIIKFQDNCTTTNNITDVSCGTHYWGTNSYTTTGTYTQNFLNQFGCDSAVTLDLTVHPAMPITDIFPVACDSFVFNGQVYHTSGLYIDTLTSVVYGCDSLVRFDLTIIPGIYNVAYLSGSTVSTYDNFGSYGVQWVDCDNNYAIISGETSVNYTPAISGSYAAILTSPSCGVDTTNCVEVCAGINNLISLSGTQLSALQAGATYQWVDCNNGNAIIPGATLQNFTPAVTGNYGVMVTVAGCTVTSSCMFVTINNTSINNEHWQGVKIYPNPATTLFTIDGLNVGAEIKILDLTGKLILNKTTNSNSLTVFTGEFVPGVYIVQVLNNENLVQKKLIIQ